MTSTRQLIALVSVLVSSASAHFVVPICYAELPKPKSPIFGKTPDFHLELVSVPNEYLESFDRPRRLRRLDMERRKIGRRITGLTCEDLIIQDIQQLTVADGHVKLEIMDEITGDQMAFQTLTAEEILNGVLHGKQLMCGPEYAIDKYCGKLFVGPLRNQEGALMGPMYDSATRETALSSPEVTTRDEEALLNFKAAVPVAASEIPRSDPSSSRPVSPLLVKTAHARDKSLHIHGSLAASTSSTPNAVNAAPKLAHMFDDSAAVSQETPSRSRSAVPEIEPLVEEREMQPPSSLRRIRASDVTEEPYRRGREVTPLALPSQYEDETRRGRGMERGGRDGTPQRRRTSSMSPSRWFSRSKKENTQADEPEPVPSSPRTRARTPSPGRFSRFFSRKKKETLDQRDSDKIISNELSPVSPEVRRDRHVPSQLPPEITRQAPPQPETLASPVIIRTGSFDRKPTSPNVEPSKRTVEDAVTEVSSLRSHPETTVSDMIASLPDAATLPHERNLKPVETTETIPLPRPVSPAQDDFVDANDKFEDSSSKAGSPDQSIINEEQYATERESVVSLPGPSEQVPNTPFAHDFQDASSHIPSQPATPKAPRLEGLPSFEKTVVRESPVTSKPDSPVSSMPLADEVQHVPNASRNPPTEQFSAYIERIKEQETLRYRRQRQDETEVDPSRLETADVVPVQPRHDHQVLTATSSSPRPIPRGAVVMENPSQNVDNERETRRQQVRQDVSQPRQQPSQPSAVVHEEIVPDVGVPGYPFALENLMEDEDMESLFGDDPELQAQQKKAYDQMRSLLDQQIKSNAASSSIPGPFHQRGAPGDNGDEILSQTSHGSYARSARYEGSAPSIGGSDRSRASRRSHRR